MRGLVFFNLHHVIFGLTAYLKKITFNNLVNVATTAGTPNPPEAVQGLSLDD